MEDQEILKDMVRNFYVDLFREDQATREDVISLATYPNILSRHAETLGADVTLLEMKNALFDMGPQKALGEDGYPAIFYQNCWEVISPIVLSFINEVWDNPESVRYVNNTLIVLINKVDKPELATQFRPIALCNVTYKIITKIIVNYIKPFLDGIISPNQSSFIPGRNIHHNIIIALERVHSMSRMKGDKVFMSIKIDLQKAYDRLNWNFIIQCLHDCHFHDKIVSIIKQCVSSSTLKLLWNGDKTDAFSPSRGIR